MKTYNIFFVLLIILSCKTTIKVIPEELNTTWYDIIKEGNDFYQKPIVFEDRPFIENIMKFASGEEYEEVKEVIKTEYGYRILFKQYRFNAEFRFYWIDKTKGIAKWEYYNKDRDPAIKNYFYYTINNLSEYDKLSPSVSIKPSNNSKPANPSDSIINKHIQENWKINCDEYAYLHIDNDTLFVFPVNSNTMTIKVRMKLDQDNYKLFYYGIEDLGRGVNESLDWNNFSKDSVLATLKIKGSYLYLNWQGYYNNSTKERVWTSQTDFQEVSGKLKDIPLRRCIEK